MQDSLNCCFSECEIILNNLVVLYSSSLITWLDLQINYVVNWKTNTHKTFLEVGWMSSSSTFSRILIKFSYICVNVSVISYCITFTVFLTTNKMYIKYVFRSN